MTDLPMLNEPEDVITFCAALGVRVEFVGVQADLDSGFFGGATDQSPDPRVRLHPDGRVLVADESLWFSAAWVHVLHEAMHLVLGPTSLADEFDLMAAEHAIYKRNMRGQCATEFRREFAAYGFDWEDVNGEWYGEIGDSDDVFDSVQWDALQQDAVLTGVLDQHYNFALRCVHPDWKNL